MDHLQALRCRCQSNVILQGFVPGARPTRLGTTLALDFCWIGKVVELERLVTVIRNQALASPLGRRRRRLENRLHPSLNLIETTAYPRRCDEVPYIFSNLPFSAEFTACRRMNTLATTNSSSAGRGGTIAHSSLNVVVFKPRPPCMICAQASPLHVQAPTRCHWTHFPGQQLGWGTIRS